MCKAVNALGVSGGAVGPTWLPPALAQDGPGWGLGWGHNGFAACNVPTSSCLENPWCLPVLWDASDQPDE